jgi:hypothetical protein
VETNKKKRSEEATIMKTFTNTVFCLLLFVGGHVIAQQPTPHDLQPQNAVEGVLNAFNKYQLVALGETHGLQDEADFIISLIQHPAFPDKVNDIVVEWGNARYQGLLDRYIAGLDVPLANVRKVWRDTTQSLFLTWDAPIYERFFVAVRAANQKLPLSKRVRVLAGDPPVDWSKSRAEVRQFLEQYKFTGRDKHLADMVEKEVLAKGRKALIVMGGLHLYRNSWNPYADCPCESKVAIDILDERHPGKVFVVMVYAFENKTPKIEVRLSAMSRPSLVLVKGTWLGAVDTDEAMQSSGIRFFPGGKVVRFKVNQYIGMRLEDLADAILYLGEHDALTGSYPTPEMYESDPEYVKELERRLGDRFRYENFWRKRKTNKYFDRSEGPTPPLPRQEERGCS